VILDFNGDNQVVGVEILNLSKRSPKLNLRELQFQGIDTGKTMRYPISDEWSPADWEGWLRCAEWVECWSRNRASAAAVIGWGECRPISQLWRVFTFAGRPAAERTSMACAWLRLLVSRHAFSRWITGALFLSDLEADAFSLSERNFSSAAAVTACGERLPISHCCSVVRAMGKPTFTRTSTACDWLRLLDARQRFSLLIRGLVIKCA